uniref:Colony stimulating factor 3 receptor n=1 Tax=Leptobrachium leishanense TaxID=445787 RepID=A0A8C5LS04_9ANUR
MKKDLCILLVVMLLLIFLPEDIQSCDSITVKSPIILGSHLTATCTVSKTLCRGLEEEEFQFQWKLDNEFIPSTQYVQPFKNSTIVTFSKFSKTSAMLSCYITGVNKQLQLIDRKYIKAGYPPSPPSNLTCLLDLTSYFLKCAWQFGRDPLIDTNVTLLSIKLNNSCEIPDENKVDVNIIENKTSGLIQRDHFNPYKKLALWVTAVNALGSAASPVLCLVPAYEVKLDPPITNKATASVQSCVRIQWERGKKGSFIRSQEYQLRYRREEEKKWTEPLDIVGTLQETELCGLLSARMYHLQLRSIRATKTGEWSEWGPETLIMTLESAPIGKLETWWTQKESKEGLPRKILLMWKELRREDANALFVWYIVKISSGRDVIVCNTTALNCSFPAPKGVIRATIWAYNMAGHSQGTEIVFLQKAGEAVSSIRVSSKNSNSLYVTWVPKLSAIGYIIEWCKTSSNPDCEINWKKEPEGSSTSVLNDNVEPYQRYTVRLYPLYKEYVGSPVSADVYSIQRAPDKAPKLTLIRAAKTEVELSWKPVPMESLHGFLTGYTIFWTDPTGNEQYMDLKDSSGGYVIRNLEPLTVYKVVLRISSSGGSTTGTVMTIHTTLFDAMEVSVLIGILSLACVMIFVVVFILYIMKHERVKNRFWPSIPDPANSSMGKWDSVEQEKPRLAFNTKDVNQIITSDITILDGLAVKKPTTLELSKNSPFLKQDYSQKCNGQSQFTMENINTLKSYVNVADTVQYAKVISGGYREQSPPSSLYVRSDSTQPLLGDASPSPKNYENMWFHCHSQEDSVFFMEEQSQTDFPLLQALKIQYEGEAFS